MPTTLTQHQQAVALAHELLMHVEDMLDEAGEQSGFDLVLEDTDRVVGKAVELGADLSTDRAFRVRTEDGNWLRVTVEVAK